MDEQSTPVSRKLWDFIGFDAAWRSCDTSKLDEITPAWSARKDELQSSSTEYAQFLEKLKRKHAIETGIIERMYDLSSGVTHTLVEQGFHDALVSHGDFGGNVTKTELMRYLHDNLNAVEYVFDFVKSHRPLSVGFIKELHHLVTAHQECTEGRDKDGNDVRIRLVKGAFKILPNNPSRLIGEELTIMQYCPPEHVQSEMDSLIQLYEDITRQNVHSAIVAAWFHHAFTLIHPFQDGNGRMARLLASLIFIKAGLFPLTVSREEAKLQYLTSLEEADASRPQPLVDYFIRIQRAAIEQALNLPTVSANASLDHLADIISTRLQAQTERKQQERKQRIAANREIVFQTCVEAINDIEKILRNKLGGSLMLHSDASSPNDEDKQHFYTRQTIGFARAQGYYFNRDLPKAHIRLRLSLNGTKRYQLVVTIHHFGYEPDTVAVGAFLEVMEPQTEFSLASGDEASSQRVGAGGDKIITASPLRIKPYKLSMDTDNIMQSLPHIKDYVADVAAVAMARIANEII